jgi:NAD(P)-dependent dehydrogenase (short-subunit alcohol dehydrogenase family)
MPGYAARQAATADLCAARPDAAAVLAMDESDQGSIQSFAAAVRARHGQVDILINNARAWSPTDGRASTGWS